MIKDNICDNYNNQRDYSTDEEDDDYDDYDDKDDKIKLI